MSSIEVTTVNSKVALTPPLIKDVNGVEIGQFCKAWVNFDGTGTVAIRDSFNVSSITDNGVGDYAVNFTNAISSVDFATVSTCSGTNTSTEAAPLSISTCRTRSFTASSGALLDIDNIYSSIFAN